MKIHVLFLLFLVLISSPNYGDDLQLLFPLTHEKISYAQGGFLKALYTSSTRTEYQLLQDTTISTSMGILSPEEKDAFPKTMMNMFTPRFNVNIMILNFIHINNDTSTYEYNFSTSRPLDLEDFWRTTDFRRALQKVTEINALNLKITLIGWNVEKRILNPLSRPNHPDLIASQLAFKPGSNSFYLHFLNEEYELQYADTLNFYYFISSLAEDVPENAVRSEFHGENEEKCSYCHTEMEEDDCSFCHSSILDKAMMHSPTEEMECNSCHDDGSDPKHQLLEDFRGDPSTCMMCHSDQEDEVNNMENIHPPMEESCLICHDPHGTSADALLVKKTNELCLSCHDHIKAGFHPVKKHPHSGYPNPLDPDHELSCASCHHPHASDEEFLLRGNWSELCQQCHFKN
ncbi:MAG: cytochrome c3 family protein [Candidatus Marinimicrobia bacterium]|nr:cytochrome c3 family protein [Candidatus Neomarinimicrobiota bacterium]